MPIEQFLFALFPDGTYRLLKSPGVNRLLSDANIQYLRMNDEDNGEPYWLPTEQVVAIQHIEHASDRDNRGGVWSHTLLVPIADYIRLTNPHKLLGKYFLAKTDEPPKALESITV